MSPLQKELLARAGDLTDVQIKKSKFSTRPALWRNGKEFTYFCKGDSVEIRITAKVSKTLKPDYRLIFKRKDWVEVTFETFEDLDYVMKLIEKAYKLY